MAEDASIRDVQVEDCARLGLITVSASLSAFLGPIPEENLDFSWTPEQSAKRWQESFAEDTDRGQAFRVLESHGRVIGFPWSGPWADAEGYVGCVKENPSCDFYRRLGGVEVGRRPARVDAHQTEEILFGWPDIKTLISPSRR